MLKMIKEGDILPNNKIVLVNADGSNEIETDKLFSNKKVVFFAIFTPIVGVLAGARFLR